MQGRATGEAGAAVARRFRWLAAVAAVVAALAAVQLLTHDAQVAASCAEGRRFCGLVPGLLARLAGWILPPAAVVAAVSAAVPRWVAAGRGVPSGWWLALAALVLVALSSFLDATAWGRVIAMCGDDPACGARDVAWWGLAQAGIYATAAAGGALGALALAAGRGVRARPTE